MTIKINKLEIENVKRVKAVKIEPTINGLTLVGGNNNQGKTSVLDSIAWALGGEKYRPSQAQRDGSVIPPYLHIVMSNGLVIERKGKNSDLKVIDSTGQKGGQQLLNDFVEQLALDLPKFMQSSNKEKAETLLQIIGVGDTLRKLEQEEQVLYNRRHTIGQISDQKKKFAKEMPHHPDAPKELISASELIKQQQEILARNGENQRKRDNALTLHAERNRLAEKVNSLKEELEKYQKQLIQVDMDMTTAYKTAEQLHDESTAELENNITNIEEINRKVRANLDKDKAEDDSKEYTNQYNAITGQINEIRDAKIDLLKTANLPLPGLSVIDGELAYNEKKWDCMSGSEQLKVSTAIVRKLNPKCGFVLLDKLEQMDLNSLKEFGQWLEEEGLQAIATRVSTGTECSIIIEDGYVTGAEQPAEEAPKWKVGEF
jgi:DNA repair exonuclease SbcCD ATPase subunit